MYLLYTLIFGAVLHTVSEKIRDDLDARHSWLPRGYAACFFFDW